MDTFSCCEEVYDPGTGVLYFSEAVDPETWPDYSIKSNFYQINSFLDIIEHFSV